MDGGHVLPCRSSTIYIEIACVAAPRSCLPRERRRRDGARVVRDYPRESSSNPKKRIQSSTLTGSSFSDRRRGTRGALSIREQNSFQPMLLAPISLERLRSATSLVTTITSTGFRSPASRWTIASSADRGAQKCTRTPGGGSERSGSSPSKKTTKRPPRPAAYSLSSDRKARRVFRSLRARAAVCPIRLFPSNQYGTETVCHNEAITDDLRLSV